MKLKIRQISESEFTVKGHGVHTAFEETVNSLRKIEDTIVIKNKRGHFDITHIHTIGIYSLFYLLFGSGKKVVTAHVVPDSFVGSIVGAKVWLPLSRLYLRWFYNRADIVLAVSGTVAKVLEDDLHVPKTRIKIHYNTVDMSQYSSSPKQKSVARKRLGLKSGDFVVLGNGQVQPRKRVDIFEKMSHELPEVEFIWVGGIPFKHLGADYQAMQEMILNTPKNLSITGVIDHEAVKDYLYAADVFCLPAEQENHPMCVLEAAGAGLPIILRDIPEYNDTFKQDIVRCKTDEDFARAVLSLKNDKKLFNSAKRQAKNIANRFDSLAGAKQLASIYKSLL